MGIINLSYFIYRVEYQTEAYLSDNQDDLLKLLKQKKEAGYQLVKIKLCDTQKGTFNVVSKDKLNQLTSYHTDLNLTLKTLKMI
jgi:hypothetical protein